MLIAMRKRAVYAALGASAATLVLGVIWASGRPIGDPELLAASALVLLGACLASVLIGLALGRGTATELPHLLGHAQGTAPSVPLHDEVTGLPTRALVRDRLVMALHETRRTRQLLVVLRVEVVDPSDLVGRLGHDAAAMFIGKVADRLCGVLRPHDTVGRVGAREFLIVCPAVESSVRAAQIEQRVWRSLASPIDLGVEQVEVAVNIVMTVTDGDGIGPHDLLPAPRAVIEPARCHLDKVVSARVDPRDDEHAARLLDELRLALDFDQLSVEYQPIVDLDSGAPVALEALIRWQHPSRGIVPAMEFFGVLESSDLVHPVGMLTLGRACRDGAALWVAGRRLGIHVNLSERQLTEPHLVQHVAEALLESGLPPEALTLEFPETKLLAASPWLVARLVELRELGVRLAIDGFGTGHGGLATLLDLDVDLVKIDRRFVSQMCDVPNARAVCSAVVSIADFLEVGSVAVGIETSAQEVAAAYLGFGWGQGNRYGRALQFSEIERWLSAYACEVSA